QEPALSAGKGAPLQIDTLLDLAIQITEGLDAADSKGVTHRDIKPANSGREIWVMGSQGDSPRKVLVLGENDSFNSEGRWSPDGQRLAYIKVQWASEGYQASIETLQREGGEPDGDCV